MSQDLPLDFEIVAAATDHCGCLKLAGQVGNHGWHWWIVTRKYLRAKQYHIWREQNPVAPEEEFIYDAGGEASYLGGREAAERCSAYVAVSKKRRSEDDDGRAS